MERICCRTRCGRHLSQEKPGARLCTSCRKRLARRLSSLPGLYLACEQILDSREYHSIRIARGHRPAGICLDEHTTAARGDTIRVLSSWCAMIVDELGATGPSSLDITLLTAFLRTHLDWLARHPAAGDFADEIAGLASSAGEALNPVHVSGVELGPCAEDGCGCMVRAGFRLGGHGSAPYVHCDAGHIWPPHQWLRLRNQLAASVPR